MIATIESPPNSKAAGCESAAQGAEIKTNDNENYTHSDEQVKEIELTIVKTNQRVRFDNSGSWVPLENPDCDQLDAVPIGAVYDASKGKFWITTNEDNWICVTDTALNRHLALDFKIPKKSRSTVVNAITRAANVEFATSLAGYRKGVYQFGGRRILVTKSPIIIEPVQGDFDTIRTLLEEMLGLDQYNYFCGWLHVAYTSLVSGNIIPGQVLVLMGQPNTYKTFGQEKIITPILGGRQGEPFQFMTSQTQFNSDLFQAEHLVISDEVPSTDQRDRKAFGSAIKKLTFNVEQRMHAKGRDAITLPPFWRISMSLNPEDINILPPMEDGLSDKMMMFKVSDPVVIKKVWDGKRDEFAEAIRKELPAFVHYIANEYKISAELRSDRTGIKSYLNPELIEGVEDVSPEAEFLSLLEMVTTGASQDDFTPAEIYQRLTDDSRTKQSALRLVKSPQSTGRMMSRILNGKGERKDSIQRVGHSKRGTLYQINRNQRVDRDRE